MAVGSASGRSRIHGTTRQQVRKVFQERSVHRDAHVEVERAYYSVPPEYVGRKVWVRWDARLVRIFNMRMDEIAVHVRREPGRFSTATEHIASEKISTAARGAGALLRFTKKTWRVLDQQQGDLDNLVQQCNVFVIAGANGFQRQIRRTRRQHW